MSTVALQRVLVRMLYDRSFVDRIYDEPSAALEGLELGEEQRGWLLRPDRRAYEVDPYRRSRSLQGLVEEYPASCALAMSRGVSWEELGAFFASELFHEGIQRGRSLALTFGGHLFELAGTYADREPWLEPMTRLERGLARVRRRITHSRGREDAWHLRDEVETLELAAGSLAAHQLVMGRLGDTSDLELEKLVDPRRLDGIQLAPLNGGREHLLLALGEEDTVRIERLSPELFAVLETARGGAAHEEMVGVCRALGADEAQTESILQDFANSGELLPPLDRRA